MKRGNVEIPLTGKLTDFDDTILLHASDVQSINQIIKVRFLVFCLKFEFFNLKY